MTVEAHHEPEQLAALCTELGITAECVEGARGPRIEAPSDGQPLWKADGWTVTLTFQGRTHVTDFWQGIGHREVKVFDQRPPSGWHKANQAALPEVWPGHRPLTVHTVEHAYYRLKPPTVADVLSCLLSDAQCAENARSFEDFASDMGYDADSRSAEQIYQACLTTFRDMHNFCGEHYERLANAEH